MRKLRILECINPDGCRYEIEKQYSFCGFKWWRRVNTNSWCDSYYSKEEAMRALRYYDGTETIRSVVHETGDEKEKQP